MLGIFTLLGCLFHSYTHAKLTAGEEYRRLDSRMFLRKDGGGQYRKLQCQQREYPPFLQATSTRLRELVVCISFGSLLNLKNAGHSWGCRSEETKGWIMPLRRTDQSTAATNAWNDWMTDGPLDRISHFDLMSFNTSWCASVSCCRQFPGMCEWSIDQRVLETPPKEIV
jgi:hypothetical protein